METLLDRLSKILSRRFGAFPRLVRLQLGMVALSMSSTAFAAYPAPVSAGTLQKAFACLSQKIAPIDMTDYGISVRADEKYVKVMLKYVGPALGGDLEVTVRRKGKGCFVTGSQ